MLWHSVWDVNFYSYKYLMSALLHQYFVFAQTSSVFFHSFLLHFKATFSILPHMKWNTFVFHDRSQWAVFDLENMSYTHK